jgi:hypothetical protein
MLPGGQFACTWASSRAGIGADSQAEVFHDTMSQIYDMYYVKVAINLIAEPSDERSHVFFAAS